MGATSGEAPIRVLLADDHPVVRAGLRATLAAPGLAVVGEAASGDEVPARCREARPDVVLLDLQMPGPPPTAVVAALRAACPEARVLVLTGHDEDAYVQELLAVGVAGYVLKDEAPEALVDAVRGVAHGGSWLSRSVVERLVQTGRSGGRAGPVLTARERQLLALVAQGWDNARLAATLHLSEQTVRSYLSRLYAKLGVRTRAEAIVWARERDFA